MMRFSPVLLEVSARDYNFGYPLIIAFKRKLISLLNDVLNYFSLAGFCLIFGIFGWNVFTKTSGFFEVIFHDFYVNSFYFVMRFSPVLLEVSAHDYNFGYPLIIALLSKQILSYFFKSCYKASFSVAGFCSIFWWNEVMKAERFPDY